MDKVPWEFRSALREIASLVSPNAETRAETLRKFEPPFCNWEAGEVFVSILEMTILWLCAEQQLETQSVRSWRLGGDFSYVTPERLVQGYYVLRNWEQQFESIVTRIAKRALTTKGSGGVRVLLTPLLKFIRPRHQSFTPLHRLIVSSLPSIVRNAGIPIKRMPGSKMFSADRTSMISGVDARELGLHANILRRLGKAADCLVANVDGKTGLKLYDCEKLRLSRAIWRDSIKISGVGVQLGVPAFSVQKFAEVGLLQLITDNDAKLLARSEVICYRSSVDCLTKQLNEIAENISGQGGGISIYAGFRERRAEPAVWAEIFAAIVSGRLAVTGGVKTGTSFSRRLLVQPDHLAKIISAVPYAEPPAVHISCGCATMVLRTSDVNVADAFRAGILPGYRRGQRIYMRLHDVVQFDREYVFPEELGVNLCVQRRKLVLALDNANVPSTKLSGSRVWRRADVMAAVAVIAAKDPTALWSKRRRAKPS